MKKLENKFKSAKNSLKPDSYILDGFIEMTELMEMFYHYLEGKMDEKIRKIEKTIKKDSSKEEKQLKHLEKADKKQDKIVAKAKKIVKKKKK